MPRDTREVDKGLTSKGFLIRESHHTYYHLYVNGKKTQISTKVSHGEREIHDRLLGKMARQVGLSKRDFLDLIDCPLSEADYVTKLRENGKVE